MSVLNGHAILLRCMFMSQTLREEIQKEYRDVVERRVFTGLLSNS
jgi:hypothetical protein